MTRITKESGKTLILKVLRASDFNKCKLYHLDIISIVSPAYFGAAMG